MNLVSERDATTLEELCNVECQDITLAESNLLAKALATPDRLFNSEEELFFSVFFETKLDKKAERGAIMKSIAIVTSQFLYFPCLNAVGEELLSQCFSICASTKSDAIRLDGISNLFDQAMSEMNGLSIT